MKLTIEISNENLKKYMSETTDSNMVRGYTSDVEQVGFLHFREGEYRCEYNCDNNFHKVKTKAERNKLSPQCPEHRYRPNNYDTAFRVLEIKP